MIRYLYEILVPTMMKSPGGELRPIRLRYHRVWDRKIIAISGGLTVMHPVKGQWVSPVGENFRERMIPVRIIATRKEMDKVIAETLVYYNQEAVLAYRIAEEVLLVHRSPRKK